MIARATSVLVALVASASPAQGADMLRLSDGPGAATCRHFDALSGLAWRHRQGDWRDAEGRAQGERAYAEAAVPDQDRQQEIAWDVTALVREWAGDARGDHGLLLQVVPGTRAHGVAFHSREADDVALRPVLDLELDHGRHERLAPEADIELNCTTYRSLGQRPTFGIGQTGRVAMRFPKAVPSGVTRATLRLTTTGRQYSSTRIGVYRLDSPTANPTPASWSGLSSGRTSDAALAGHPDVILVEGFDDREWTQRWSHVGPRGTWTRVTEAPGLGFAPLEGAALQARIPKGRQLALDVRYDFRDKLGEEPEEIYFRYYLRLGSDFRPTRDGGKLPGIAGTYNRAGWGGRPSDGTNGWSLRGGFGLAAKDGHPLAGGVPIHTYAYHAKMKGDYGEVWHWSIDRPGVLAPQRWYCLEQHVRMNTPGHADGVMRAWIDGAPALERTGVVLRTVDALRIENVWLDVYHGGTSVSPHDQHLYIDDVVIARKPIGCRQVPQRGG